MVCLANSTVARGRIIVGVLMAEGVPMVDEDGPRWLQLVVDSHRLEIPTGLVVDILPRDIVEFEALGMDGTEHCRGKILYDPYSLRFVGEMPECLVASYCLSKDFPGNSQWGKPNNTGMLALIHASNCKVESSTQARKRAQQWPKLLFELEGMVYRLPILDSCFVNALEADSNPLTHKSSLAILLHQPEACLPQQPQPVVMTLLV